jgi:predicted house-cleaning noncanonical NTP pyrophosphatase (MazG superfamily)
MGKLVRDKIPAIIRATGEEPVVRVLSPEEYLPALLEKLVEESLEAQEAGVEDLLNELADVQEVIRAILDALDWDARTLEEVAERKVEARGAFTARLWLE